ncbi:hypothetical protein BAE44_0024843, partial [Dichanthelium oligosanthes]
LWEAYRNQLIFLHSPIIRFLEMRVCAGLRCPKSASTQQHRQTLCHIIPRKIP